MTNFIVNSLEDTVVADGKVTLREAIEAANTNTSVGDAPAGIPGADTIDFDEGLSEGTITLTSGELQITDDLTINGLGADELTVSGNNQSRVFVIDDGDQSNQIDVVIDGLTITEGATSGNGGGILNEDSLTLTQSTVSNSSALNGGGIYNQGVATLINSNLSNNFTAIVPGVGRGGGGGILNSRGTLSLVNSTISCLAFKLIK